MPLKLAAYNFVPLVDLFVTAMGLIPEYTGTRRYVSPNGDDSDGLGWDTAYNNPNDAIGDCVIHDVVLIEGGYTYDVDDTLDGLILDVNEVRVTGVGSDRPTIKNTDTTADGSATTITGSGILVEFVRMRKGETTSTGAASLRFTGGSSNRVYNCIAQLGNDATHVGVHFNSTAAGCIFTGDGVAMSGIVGATTGTAIYFEDAIRCAVLTAGIGITTLGVRYGSSSLYCSTDPSGLLQDCDIGHQLDAGALYSIVRAEPLRCTVGVIDNSGSATNYIGEFGVEHDEHLYPMCDGEGASITIPSVTTDAADETNGAASTRYYWGEPTAIIPRDSLTSVYELLGLEIVAFTAGKSFQWALYFDRPSYQSAKNAGNAWDEGATALTVTDGSLFSDEDLVAIYSDYKVEIVKVNGAPAGNVVTIEREGSQFGAANTGLRWDHSTNDPGTEEMTVVHRSGILHVVEGHITWEGLYRLHRAFNLNANSFVLMRAINLTDSTNAAAITVFPIYES